MEEYTDQLRQHLDKNRNWTKKRFKVAGTLYRGITKGRFTKEQGLNALNKL